MKDSGRTPPRIGSAWATAPRSAPSSTEGHQHSEHADVPRLSVVPCSPPSLVHPEDSGLPNTYHTLRMINNMRRASGQTATVRAHICWVKAMLSMATHDISRTGVYFANTCIFWPQSGYPGDRCLRATSVSLVGRGQTKTCHPLFQCGLRTSYSRPP